MKKVAVIGAGTMGRVHAAGYARIKDVEIVGIADTRISAAQQLADQFGIRAYSSLEELLRLEEPDVVDICLPTYLHRQYVERVARAKKHVICEKPIARTLEDARAMIDTCRQEGVHLYIAHVVRFFAEYRKAYDLVKSGAVGEVGTVHTRRNGFFPSGWEDWYASVDKSGTLLVDLVIHDFDYLRWCFGEVERVFAKALAGRDLNRLDHAFVILRFKNGVIAHVEGSWAYPSGFYTEMEIAGREGIIRHNSEEAAPIRVSLRKGASGTAGVALPESPLKYSPYQLELEHFLDCIYKGKESVVTAEDAYRALQISLAALKSVQTGQPVDL